MYYQIETNNWFVRKAIYLFYRLGVLRFTKVTIENGQSKPIIEVEEAPTKEEALESIKNALQEVRLHEAGTPKFKPVAELFNEL